MTNEMKRSWLVQRLEKPRSGFAGNVSEVFAFGGGLKNGGLTDDAMRLLRGVFSFDYMGAAEFEFGAVPQALQGIAKDAKKLVAFEFSIDLATVEPDWRNRTAPAPEGEATVYAIARKDQAAEVEARVREWASKDHAMKESTHLPRTLLPANEWDGSTVGWLELNNGFFAFTDREMWAQTCALFGLSVEAVTR